MKNYVSAVSGDIPFAVDGERNESSATWTERLLIIFHAFCSVCSYNNWDLKCHLLPTEWACGYLSWLLFATEETAHSKTAPNYWLNKINLELKCSKEFVRRFVRLAFSFIHRAKHVITDDKWLKNIAPAQTTHTTRASSKIDWIYIQSDGEWTEQTVARPHIDTQRREHNLILFEIILFQSSVYLDLHRLQINLNAQYKLDFEFNDSVYICRKMSDTNQHEVFQWFRICNNTYQLSH